MLACLRQMRQIVNAAKLAKLSGMNENTFRSKLRRSTPFTPREGAAIRAAFEKLGVSV